MTWHCTVAWKVSWTYFFFGEHIKKGKEKSNQQRCKATSQENCMAPSEKKVKGSVQQEEETTFYTKIYTVIQRHERCKEETNYFFLILLMSRGFLSQTRNTRKWKVKMYVEYWIRIPSTTSFEYLNSKLFPKCFKQKINMFTVFTKW